MKNKKEEKFNEADYIIWSCGGRHVAKALYGRRFKKLDEVCKKYEAEKFFQFLHERLKKIEESKKNA